MVAVKRPIMWLTAAYGLGIILAELIGTYMPVVWAIAMIAILSAWVFNFKGRTCFHLLLVAVSLTGTINAQLAVSIGNPLIKYMGQDVRIYGSVVEVPQYRDGRDVYIVRSSAVVTGSRVDEVDAMMRVTVFPIEDDRNHIKYKKGDLLSLEGEPKIPRGRRNPGGFDYREYLVRRGIQSIMSLPSVAVNKVGEIRLRLPDLAIEHLRTGIHKIFREGVGGREADLMIAMMLGDRWLLSEWLTRDFEQTGLSHILAISGLHVGFILILLNALLSMLPLSPKRTVFIKMAVLWAYCILVGASPPVVRATIMATVYLGARLAGRKPDALNSLMFAAMGILLVRPLDLLDVGFQLSFGAVLGMILFSRPIAGWFSMLPKWLASSLSITLAAQLGVGPLIAYYFNMLSPVSLVANLIFVPLSGIMVILGFIVMVVGLILPMPVEMLAWPLKLMGWLLIEGTGIMADFPMAFVNVISPSLLFIACYYAALWISSNEKPAWVRRPALWCGFLASVLLAVAFIQPLVVNDLKVVFLDVGQGDSIYIRTPDEKHILVDAGGSSFGLSGGFEPGEDVVLPFLLKNGVGKLDLVIMSHAHDDHIGGLVAVLREMPVGAFMEYPPGEYSQSYIAIQEMLTEKGIRHFKAAAGDTYGIGNHISLEILYPDREGHVLRRLYDGDENNRSLVFLLRYGTAEVMFTGDIYAGVEEYISKQINTQVDILKVAHHGSRTSSASQWLEAISPYLGVIQVGENRFGHPDEGVLNRFEEQSIKVLRNDLHGAVICLFNGDNWRIRWMVDEQAAVQN